MLKCRWNNLLQIRNYEKNISVFGCVHFGRPTWFSSLIYSDKNRYEKRQGTFNVSFKSTQLVSGFHQDGKEFIQSLSMQFKSIRLHCFLLNHVCKRECKYGSKFTGNIAKFWQYYHFRCTLLVINWNWLVTNLFKIIRIELK
jgi:hypothetical protein